MAADRMTPSELAGELEKIYNAAMVLTPDQKAEYTDAVGEIQYVMWRDFHIILSALRTLAAAKEECEAWRELERVVVVDRQAGHIRPGPLVSAAQAKRDAARAKHDAAQGGGK